MDWGLLALCGNVLLLASGWFLFQQAKSALANQALDAPVLKELKALQQSVALLVEKLRLESAQCSAQVEARCLEARDLLVALERKLEEAEARAAVPGRTRARTRAAEPRQAEDTAAELRAAVLQLADSGLDAATIAREIGLSQGEVEVMLSLEGRTAEAAAPPVNTTG